MRQIVQFYILSIVMLLSHDLEAQFSVTSGATVDEYVQTLLGTDLITIHSSSITAVSSIGTSDFERIGVFQNQNSALEFDEGIVLTTGFINQIPTPFNNSPGSANNSSASCTPENVIKGCPGTGDEDLDEILRDKSSSNFTQDAVALEIEFSAPASEVSFEYVFASEEYGDFTCSSLNDIFAFFIEGVTVNYPKTNIATIEGTNLPVAVNTINNGQKGSDVGVTTDFCVAPFGSKDFTDLYVDNTQGEYIQYDGFTTVLKATSPIIPCERYKLKIVLADVGDSSYDSGVFLKSNSLVINNVEVEQNAFVDNLGDNLYIENCRNDKLIFKLPNPSPIDTLKYKLNATGTAIAGVDYEAFPDTIKFPPNVSTLEFPFIIYEDNIPELEETVELSFELACNSLEGSTILRIQDKEVFSTDLSVQSTVLCDGVEFSWDPDGLTADRYEISLDNGVNWNPPSGNFKHLVEGATGATVDFQVRALSNYPCGDTPISSLSATLPFLQADLSSQKSQLNCFGDSDGDIALNIEANNYPLSYQWSDQNNSNNLLVPSSPINRNNLVADVYIVTVTDDESCTAVISLTINEPNLLDFSVTPIDIKCEGDEGRFFTNVSGGNSPYVLTINNVVESLGNFIAEPGAYTLYLEDSKGCDTSVQENISVGVGIDLVVEAIPEKCSFEGGGSIDIIRADGGTDPRELFFNGQVYDANNLPPIFEGLPGGSYTARVVDNNGCSVDTTVSLPNPIELYVGDYAPLVEPADLTLIELIGVVDDDLEVFWTPMETVSCIVSSCEGVFVSPDTTTSYVYEAFYEPGCSPIVDTVEVIVKQTEDDLFIPNAFTPNGDGVNDVFSIQANRSVSIIRQFIVFDRWGAVVFEANDFEPVLGDDTFGWDGSFGTDGVNEGVYVYYAIVEYRDGVTKEFAGDVMLLR